LWFRHYDRRNRTIGLRLLLIWLMLRLVLRHFVEILFASSFAFRCCLIRSNGSVNGIRSCCWYSFLLPLSMVV
jgi:hypothetical protein